MLEIAKTKIILYHNYRKAGSQQNWGCISISNRKKLTKRRQLTHPYIGCVSTVGNHVACHTYSFWEKMECTSWNHLKFPLHFTLLTLHYFACRSNMNWISQNHVQKMYYWEGEGEDSTIPQVHFSASKD